MSVRPTTRVFARVWLRDDGKCARCGGEVWGTRGFDYSLHHRRPAGCGGDPRPETHAAGNLVLLHGHGTAGCHGETESRRADAFASGLLVHRSDTPARSAINHAVHGWCYLLDDGTVSLDPPEVSAA